MSLSNAAETAFLNLLFNNTNWANIGDATGLRGSTAAGVFYISLHTADPGEAGSQTTSEATYTGYARIPVVRTSSGFTIAGNAVSNAALVAFAQCTAGSNTITHFGIGSDISGAGNLLESGALSASLNVSNLITPQFSTGQLTTTAD
jgi:predicted small secreted protein